MRPWRLQDFNLSRSINQISYGTGNEANIYWVLGLWDSKQCFIPFLIDAEPEGVWWVFQFQKNWKSWIYHILLWDRKPWDKNKPPLDWEWRVYWLTCFNIKFDFFTVDHVCWAGENTIFKFTTPRTVSKSFIWVVVIFYNNLWSDVFISLFKITES